MFRKKRLERRPPRGNLLAGAIAVVAMLMTVVLALHYYQSIGRQAYMVAEAELRFREGSRFVLQQQAGGGGALPSDLVMTATVANVTPGNVITVGNLVAKNVFDRTSGLPDLRALENSPAHGFLKLTPSTSDLGLRVFGKKTYSVVLNQVFGYAAYAPAGSVNVSDLRGWSNPTYADTRKSTEAYSGVPAIVAARLNAKSEQVTYGELHVIEGTAKIASGQQGVAFKAAQFPIREYSDALFLQLNDAKSKLTGAAASGDKTESLVSDAVGPSAVMDLLFGGSKGLEKFLSLRNATQFWLPMIPGFCPSPPYLYEFYFSVPYPPDNASFDSATGDAVNKDLQDIQNKMTESSKKVKAAKEARDAAAKAFQDNPTVANQNALNDAQAKLDQASAEFSALQDQAKSKTSQLGNLTDPNSNAGMKGVPLTRSQDPSGDDGQFGWNYSVAWKLLSKLIAFMFSFDPNTLAQAVVNDQVKLVHFGSKEREFHFDLRDTSMVLDGTLTVPRGRSLKLRSLGSITVRGDLWLQRGSTLVLECTRFALECPPGNSASSSFWTPCGRVFLEEGASLVCSGDIDVPGSADWGSVIVGGMPGQIHPITTAIMGKSVNLSNGVFAGTTLDDLTTALVKDAPALQGVNDKLLRPLMTSLAPNAAKVAGPFWARKPYFAKYATTFQVICPPLPPVGEPGPPIPTPIPLPHTNVLNPIAQALGYVYSVTLNASLGENFYTHCDWWIFGEGVVPMVPQVDPTAVSSFLNGLPALALDVLDPKSILTSVLTSVAKDLAVYVIEEVAKKVVAKIIEVIPYAGIGGALDSVLSACMDGLKAKMKTSGDAGDGIVSSLTSAVSDAGKQTLTKLQSKVEMSAHDLFLREYNGVLVYGDSITVGGKNASGMFLAENNLTINSQRCVGTLISHKGDINCVSLLYYPYFNRASFYLPKATASDWLGRATEFAYDKDFTSDLATDVGPPAIPQAISTEGWSN